MTTDPVALGRAWLEAVNRDDYDALVAASTEDVVVVPRLAAVDGNAFQGHDGLRDWLDMRSDAWPEMEGDVMELRPVGAGVIGVGVLRGASPTGMTFEERIAGVLRFRDGKAYWVGFFRTEAEALEAAGL